MTTTLKAVLAGLVLAGALAVSACDKGGEGGGEATPAPAATDTTTTDTTTGATS